MKTVETIVPTAMGANEEFGWRGFAQPILQDRYTAVHAALLIGGLCAVWHYYFFFHGIPWTQEVNIVFYTGRLVTVSLIYAWIYNGTGGSALSRCRKLGTDVLASNPRICVA